MPQQQAPFLEGKYGWNFGESGWDIGMNDLQRRDPQTRATTSPNCMISD